MDAAAVAIAGIYVRPVCALGHAAGERVWPGGGWADVAGSRAGQLPCREGGHRTCSHGNHQPSHHWHRRVHYDCGRWPQRTPIAVVSLFVALTIWPFVIPAKRKLDYDSKDGRAACLYSCGSAKGDNGLPHILSMLR
jgi:hypothetical protein